MTEPEHGIASRRLHAQRLLGTQLTSAVDAVRWLGAAQSQDYGAAKWALGQRTQGTTNAELDHLFDQGAILRTHVLRPTWHFVAPEDIRWMLQLSGPRVRRGLQGRHRRLEIDGEQIDQAAAAFSRALTGGRHLTRSRLRDVLQRAGISPEGQRLPHLLMAAELDGLITSGPRRGKEFTYALLEERAPRAPALDRDEALAELATRYFRSHGPAQLQDFVWWSGLTIADARRGIAAADGVIERELIDGNEYWSDAQAAPSAHADSAAHLLANFDEYTVAYRDRSAVEPDGPFDPSLFPFGSILSNVLLVGGRVRGSWRRTLAHGEVRVETRLSGALAPREQAAVEAQGERLGAFLGTAVRVMAGWT